MLAPGPLPRFTSIQPSFPCIIFHCMWDLEGESWSKEANEQGKFSFSLDLFLSPCLTNLHATKDCFAFCRLWPPQIGWILRARNYCDMDLSMWPSTLQSLWFLVRCLHFGHLQWWIHFSLAVTFYFEGMGYCSDDYCSVWCNDHERSFHGLHLFLLSHD